MGMPVNKPGTITREESIAHIIESIAAQESAWKQHLKQSFRCFKAPSARPVKRNLLIPSGSARNH